MQKFTAEPRKLSSACFPKQLINAIKLFFSTIIENVTIFKGSFNKY